MNKIFKVKKNALGQSVACSELATSRSKSRVVATALALAVASGVSMAQDVQFDIDGTQINNLIKASTGQDAQLQGPRKVNINLNDFGKLTLEALAGSAETIFRLKEDVDAVTNTAIANKIDTVHNKADIAENKKNIAENKAYLDSVAEGVLANKVASTRNKADIAANKEYVDVLTKTVISNKIDTVQNKADIDATARYVNGLRDIVNDNAIEVAKIEGLQAQITANQADSAKNFTDTNANIKANKDALETKVEKRDFYHVQDNVNSNNTEIAKLQANKADVEYVDNVAEGVLANKVASATNKADIAKNKKDIAANKEHVDVLTDTVIANKVDIVHNKAKIHMLETSVNSFQNQTLDLTSTKARVSALENRTSALETRVNKLNKNLSAGIAGTAALSMMPTAGEKGAHYITAGAGHYNGQQAIAIGLTGNSNSGKFNYKVGASATTSGSPVVGAGVGYRWK